MILLIVIPILTGLLINGQPIETGVPNDALEVSTNVPEDNKIVTTGDSIVETPDKDKPVRPVSQLTYYHNNIDPIEGTYEYGFETDNGIRVEETGRRKEFIDEETGKPTFGTESSGSYSYVHDGQNVTVSWVANEKGFQPKVEITPL